MHRIENLADIRSVAMYADAADRHRDDVALGRRQLLIAEYLANTSKD
jgi:hypothetical protein